MFAGGDRRVSRRIGCTRSTSAGTRRQRPSCRRGRTPRCAARPSPAAAVGGTTRWTVERHWSLVHCAVRSPRLITNASSAGITSIHSPSGPTICRPGDRLGPQHRDDAIVGVRSHALLAGKRIVLAGAAFVADGSHGRRRAIDERREPTIGKSERDGEDLGQGQCEPTCRRGSTRRAQDASSARHAGQMLGANAPCCAAA